MADITVIRDALLAINPGGVYQGFAAKAEAPYHVWDMDGAGDTAWGDNRMVHQVLGGTVDLFTRGPDPDLFQKTQQALNGVCAWSLESVQHEEDTGLTHYEWRWEVV